MFDIIEIDRALATAKPIKTPPGQTVGGAIPDAKAKELLSRQATARAVKTAKAKNNTRGQHIERAIPKAKPCGSARAQTHSPPPLVERKPATRRGADTSLAGQMDIATQVLDASQTRKRGQPCVVTQTPCAAPPIDAGHSTSETHPARASINPIAIGQEVFANHVDNADGNLIPRIVEEWRRRQDFLRARTRLELQAQAICRRYVDGDKVEAAKLWAAIKADPTHDMRAWCAPFIAAMAPLDSAKGDIEKALVKLVKQTPVYEWAQGIRGLGDVSLAAILGECAIGPGEYKSVSALWKRMGLAVIDGGRQRRVLGAAALDHGYNAERRSLMWNISASLIKAQLRSEKGEDGKKVEGSGYSLGELGQVYIDRKAYQNERNAERDEPWTPAHIHNDAARFMAKRLLRMLWQVWRQAGNILETNQAASAANTIQGAIIKAKPAFAPPPETNSRRARKMASHNAPPPGGEP